jgi:hypothetical protein
MATRLKESHENSNQVSTWAAEVRQVVGAVLNGAPGVVAAQKLQAKINKIAPADADDLAFDGPAAVSDAMF